MIYLYIESEYGEYLFHHPDVRLYDKKLGIPFKGSGEVMKIQCNHIKELRIIEDPQELEQILKKIVNNNR